MWALDFTDTSVAALEAHCRVVDEYSRAILAACDYPGYMLNPPPATTHLLQCIRSQLSWLVLTFSTQLSEGDNDVNGHRVALHVSVALWAGIIRHLVNPRFTIDELCTVVSYIPDIEAERIMQAGDDFISMFLRIPETLKVYQAIAQVRPQLKNMLCMRLASAGLTPLPATTYATYGVGC